MKIEEVERLLAVFYEGKTTEEQEKALKEYFETQDVPEQLLMDKKFFLSFRSEPEIVVPEKLEAELIRLIDAKEEEEKRFWVKNRSKRNRKWVGGIAASVVVLLGLSFGILNFYDGSPKETFKDPKEAYKALQDALIEVSSTMNDGIDQLADSRQEFKKVNKEIIEEINN